jgi:TonB-linked SusC/RagA family outer membrane protein
MRKVHANHCLVGCLLAAFTLTNASVKAQNSYAYGSNTLQKPHKNAATNYQGDTNIEKQRLFTVLKELNKTRGVYFLFSEQSLGSQLVNPVPDKTLSIDKILEGVLKNTGLKFKKVNDKTFVILTEKEKSKAGTEYNPVNFMIDPVAEAKPGEAAEPADPVTGKVTAPDGTPLGKVSVTIKGTNHGTTTNNSGVYLLQANKGDVLVFSSVGFVIQEVTVGDNNEINVSLAIANLQLNEVVVTALGIQRKSKSLTYSTQKVDGKELTTVKETNPINSLAGKISGLQINRSSSGVGGSSRVILRGQKSTRENQPLYVIDGVPMANFTGSQPTDIWGQSSGAGSGGRDGGDILSTINPEDIESINVLKGASASALYGSQAGNGVILINTKKGRSGQSKIDFSSSVTLDQPVYRPELQYSYLQTSPGNIYSWGAAGSSPDHVKSFFRTGTTFINSISLSAGNDKAQSYFSYSNTTNRGIMPTSTFNQHTFNFRETGKFLNDKLSIDGNILLTTQAYANRPTSGLYYNSLTGLYLFPRGLNFDQYKAFEYLSPSRNLYLQNWWNINYDKGDVGQDNQQNPYWILNRNTTANHKDNVIASLNLRYAITNWLSIQARGTANKNWDNYDLKAYASTQGTLADFNGRYTLDRSNNTLFYGDLILSGNRNLAEKIGLLFNAGTSIQDTRLDQEFMDSKGADLAFANVFHFGNINPTASATFRPSGSRKQIQSVFATASLNWNEAVYLDMSVRNDWSSALAYTPSVKNGYLYYSFGLNTILSELVHLPYQVNYSKVRLSYAQVGNDVDAFATLPVNTIVSGTLNPISSGPYNAQYLKPEATRSFEIGTEWRLWERLYFDFTWYKSNTKNQFFTLGAPRGSGLSTFFLNAGNIQNSGIEATLGYDIIKTSTLTWTSTFNFTHNTNKIVELAPQLGGSYDITGAGVNNYSLKIREGGSFGDIYGKKFMRATDGTIIVDSAGHPQGGSFDYLGNPTPKFLLGWNNSLTWKKFTASVLIDGRFGGKVMSITQAMLDEYGVSKKTAEVRQAGGLEIPATYIGGGKYAGKLPAEAFYTTVGGRAGITEYYMYDATNIRVRELAIGYKIPVKSKTVRDMKVSLVGRNLFFITKKAPFDPELSMSTGNGLQGVDVFALPSTRSYGVSLNVSF